MIELKDLVKRYGDHVAVDHLNLTLDEGKIYGFLGPNGAGKSTTMNMITGYLSATEGEIIINGHTMLHEPEEAKRCIGYLPELPPLYTDMTVEEYLTFCAELKDIAKAVRAEQVKQVVTRCRLEPVYGRLLRNLSKGYRQRVGLAQALLGFPPIIILDEPTVGLDPKQMIEIRDLIRSLAAEHTVILSSHILSEVQAVCDQIIIMHHGHLLANDTPEHLEQRLRGAGTLHMSIRGAQGEVSRILGGVDGVQSLTVTPDALGDTTAVLTLDSGTDPREDIFYALAQARMPILELRAESASLEQVFLALTEEEEAVPKEPPKRRFSLKKRTVTEEVSDK